MPSITIRDVPSDARAARSGRSLQEYLRLELIELARRPDTAALLAAIRGRKARTATTLTSEQILRLRDTDRA